MKTEKTLIQEKYKRLHANNYNLKYTNITILGAQ